MNYLNDLQALLNHYFRYILLLAAGVLIAYGYLAFNPILTGDDWQTYQFMEADYSWVISIGRWGQWVIWHLMGDNYFAPPLTLAVWFATSLVSVWIQVKTVGLYRDYSLFAYAAMFLFFPFWVEAINFKMMHVTVGVGVIFAALQGYLTAQGANHILAQRSRPAISSLLLAAICFCVSAAMYQGFIFIGIITYTAGILYQHWILNRETTKQTLIRFSLLGITTVAGIMLYLISVQLSQAITGVPALTSGPYALRDSLITSSAELSFTVQRFLTYIQKYLFRAQHFFPAAAKYLFLLILSALGGMFIYRQSIRHIAFVVAVLAFIIILPWTLGILRTPENTYRYNALLSNGAVYGVIVGLALDYARHPRLRLALGSAFALLLVIFLFQQSAARHITFQINQRDMAIVNRIVNQVETHPNFRELPRMNVITIGAPEVSAARPFSPVMTSGPMNSSIVTCGIFNCQITRLPWAMRLVQHGTTAYYPLLWQNIAAERRPELEAVIMEMAEWPQQGSIEITDHGELIIVFSKQGFSYGGASRQDED